MKRKYCIFILIGFLLLLGSCLFLFRVWQIRDNRLRQTRRAEAFLAATYAGDTDAILAMLPDSLYERLLADNIGLVDSADEIPAFVCSDLEACLETIETLFGEGWQYSFEITDQYTYTKEELEDLNTHYRMTGIPDASFRQASILTATVSITGVNGSKGAQTILVPLVKADGRWYIGQQIGSAYNALADEGAYDIYGRLLDGFSLSYEPDAEEAAAPGEDGDFTAEGGADE